MTAPKTPALTVDCLVELPGDRLVLIQRAHPPLGWALPGGFVDVATDADLEACALRKLKEKSGIAAPYLEQVGSWGDAKREPPRTRNVDWVTEMNRVYGDYFGQRPGIVLGQLRAKGWYPAVAAPSFNQIGGNVPYGFQLTLSAPAGTIYYTRDGSDPRLSGGAVSAAALVYSGPLALTQSAEVKARVLSGSTWSALTEATFYIIQNFSGLLVTEIMYHPPSTTNYDGDTFEFV